MRLLIAALVALSLLGVPVIAHAQGTDHTDHAGAAAVPAASGHASLGHQLPWGWVTPFCLLLLGIAVLPLFAGHWWEHNRNKGIVVAVLSIPVAAYLVMQWGEAGQHQLIEKGAEYLSFMVLLGSLFVITGNTYVRGSITGTPGVNATMLGLGAVIASFVGTTGASMLLIRPLLRANAPRTRKAHTVILFIFMVSNCGGLLTPLGDPPLYLGFLKGVPFQWTFRLWKEWLTVNGLLLVIYFAWDRLMWVRDSVEMPRDEPGTREGLRLDGWWNLLFLMGIVVVIAAGGNGIGTGGVPWKFPIPEILMAALAAGSFLSTPRSIREANRFSFGPINEVAIIFAGIFVTMIPALLLLNAHGGELGVREPWQFFWASGLLSSVLDNAPTYLTFAATACGLEGVAAAEGKYLAEFLAKGEPAEAILAAISCGSVFMGANTYIGNGPNFMVKAIAEESGVKMPSFFGYMKYSGLILIPIFIVVTLIYFL